MEYGRVPRNFLKKESMLTETEYAAKNSDCRSRKATAAEFAALEPKKTLTVDICAELGLKRKPEKPVIPFEEMAVRSRVAENIKFEKAVG